MLLTSSTTAAAAGKEGEEVVLLMIEKKMVVGIPAAEMGIAAAANIRDHIPRVQKRRVDPNRDGGGVALPLLHPPTLVLLAHLHLALARVENGRRSISINLITGGIAGVVNHLRI